MTEDRRAFCVFVCRIYKFQRFNGFREFEFSTEIYAKNAKKN